MRQADAVFPSGVTVVWSSRRGGSHIIICWYRQTYILYLTWQKALSDIAESITFNLKKIKFKFEATIYGQILFEITNFKLPLRSDNPQQSGDYVPLVDDQSTAVVREIPWKRTSKPYLSRIANDENNTTYLKETIVYQAI